MGLSPRTQREFTRTYAEVSRREFTCTYAEASSKYLCCYFKTVKNKGPFRLTVSGAYYLVERIVAAVNSASLPMGNISMCLSVSLSLVKAEITFLQMVSSGLLSAAAFNSEIPTTS